MTPSKRELFAAMAMQGLIAEGDTLRLLTPSADQQEYKSTKAAELAVQYADALLAELEKNNEPTYHGVDGSEA